MKFFTQNISEFFVLFDEKIEESIYFEEAFETIYEHKSFLMEFIRKLYLSRVWFLENSDICNNCEERFLLEDLRQDNDYNLICNNYCG